MSVCEGQERVLVESLRYEMALQRLPFVFPTTRTRTVLHNVKTVFACYIARILTFMYCYSTHYLIAAKEMFRHVLNKDHILRNLRFCSSTARNHNKFSERLIQCDG